MLLPPLAGAAATCHPRLTPRWRAPLLFCLHSTHTRHALLHYTADCLHEFIRIVRMRYCLNCVGLQFQTV